MTALLSDADFRDTHVFIAGGSSGINLGIAHRFAETGAKVSICSRSAERVDGAVGELTAHGGDVFGTSADVRDYAQIDGALKEAVARHGPIHSAPLHRTREGGPEPRQRNARRQHPRHPP